ncbi:SGNH/GDSL hydrolase family protein [Klebsiella pneumoniae]|uniref:SGNH/GDSL hydrolase family protein n=1 Tax=Klebsiella pneumoniae TaxID=573 RepID=UPI00190F2341|nr:SGNH/GDSL hydrolase family protein [Klebsiella pneumoniae]
MNFKYVFRWHVPFLLLFLFTCRAMAADTLLILGDSLSAGYRMAANAEPLLMQIHLPANYGRRYNEAFGAIYPALAKEFAIPLLPFFMEEVYLKPQWMQDDGIHPNRDAQPFIADWMAKRLAPLVNHDS